MTASDLILVKTATPPLSFSTSSIGGAKTTTQITGSAVGEVHFAMESNGSGGGNRDQYSKFHAKNNHGTDTASNCRGYIENALDDVSGGSAVSITPGHATDGTTTKYRVIGATSGGATIEDVTASSTTRVSSSALFTRVDRVLKLHSSTLVPTAAVANATIEHGVVVIGMIPAGMYTATNEIKIGLALALDDTATTTNAGVAPSSVSFFRPRTLTDALTFVSGGTLGPGVAMGIWSFWRLAELAKSSSDNEFGFVFKASI